uniref:Glycosyl hydrolase family 31 C-terminal domain-containing protein n=1 Tax=Sinocyclocheilus rhinocerous TaxID=307959 RepID=A0A673KGS3_9TELE
HRPPEHTVLTNRYFSGGALLVCPVTDPGVTEVKVLLPGSDEVSLISICILHKGARTLDLPVTLNTVPVFQRGGTVVPRRAGCGSSTADLQQHPITLSVALDTKVTHDNTTESTGWYHSTGQGWNHILIPIYTLPFKSLGSVRELILLFSKDALNRSKVTVKKCMMLKKMSIARIRHVCSFPNAFYSCL